MKFALTLLAAKLIAGAAQAADPVKIRLSDVVAPSDWAPLLPEKPDLLKHNGKSYSLEVVRVNGTPALVQAMAANEIEVGNHSYSSLGIAIQNAGMDDLRIISDQFKDGVPGKSTTQYYVLKDGPIRSATTPTRRSASRSRTPAWTTCASSPTSSRTACRANRPRSTTCSRTARSDRQPLLLVARHRDPERRHGRPAHHLRPVPGRRAGQIDHAVLRAQGRPDPEGRGPQGQGGVEQRRGLRGRRRDARDAEEARPRGQARLHPPRSAAARAQGHAAREEDRPDLERGAVPVRSGTAREGPHAAHLARHLRHHPDDR